MPELTLQQGTIRYRDEGAGPVLFFVHGALVDGRGRVRPGRSGGLGPRRFADAGRARRPGRTRCSGGPGRSRHLTSADRGTASS